MSTAFKTVLLFGPPGSGKGTQGVAIGTLPGFFHCSSGDVFRSLDPESELGKVFKQYSTRGELVPDDVTIDICTDFLNKQVDAGKFNPANDVLLLDGLPRNVAQAQALDGKIDVIKVVYLEASDTEALVQRLKKRALDSGRADDADENVIRNRMQVYTDETAPVLAHYPESVIAKIDALPTPAEVMRMILDALIPAIG